MNSMIQHPARTTMMTKNKNYFQPTLHSYISDELSSLNEWKHQDDGDDVPDGVVVHPTPLPDNNPKSFLSQLARCGNRNYVLYLCCIESSKDFIDGLKKCELSCGNSDQKENFQWDGQKICTACFQRDGTRHISLWQGQLSTKIAKTIINWCHNKNISRIPITHVQFTDGWNNWKAGNYLGLDQSTMTDPLRILKSTIVSGIVTSSTNMRKPNCDHLSLYCQRGQSRQDVTDTIACVRTVLHNHHWSKLPVHSICLKILGGEYN